MKIRDKRAMSEKKQLKVVQDEDGMWRVVEDYHVDVGFFWMLLKSGTRSDGSSVPRAFWWLIRPSQNLVASFVHDEMYEMKKLPRWFCDLVYWAILQRDDGLATDAQAFIAWAALRMFGWWGWYGYGKRWKGWLLR